MSVESQQTPAQHHQKHSHGGWCLTARLRLASQPDGRTKSVLDHLSMLLLKVCSCLRPCSTSPALPSSRLYPNLHLGLRTLTLPSSLSLPSPHTSQCPTLVPMREPHRPSRSFRCWRSGPPTRMDSLSRSPPRSRLCAKEVPRMSQPSPTPTPLGPLRWR